MQREDGGRRDGGRGSSGERVQVRVQLHLQPLQLQEMNRPSEQPPPPPPATRLFLMPEAERGKLEGEIRKQPCVWYLFIVSPPLCVSAVTGRCVLCV